ncbi:MAG: PspC domain-containing protein [Anaerolineae bacterium]|nr:PspC domain-containing protein [Anaerolineae bacterium]
MFAGVCGGIAEYLDVDPTLVRLVFAALVLMGGPGIIVYIVLMLIVPEEPVQKWKAKRPYSDDYEPAYDEADDTASPVIRSVTRVEEPEEIQIPPSRENSDSQAATNTNPGEE